MILWLSYRHDGEKGIVMTEAFLRKVMYEEVYDTKRYRYWCDFIQNRILRIKIEYLDTIYAYDYSNWEVVKQL